MKNLRKENLPKKAVEKLKLDEMTEVFWSEDRKKYVSADHKPVSSLAFAGVGLVTVSYSVEVKKSDHYLCREDPYYAERGEVDGVSCSIIAKPDHATHYCLGPKTVSESVTSGATSRKRKTGDSEDIFPIAYLYTNQVTPSNKE